MNCPLPLFLLFAACCTLTTLQAQSLTPSGDSAGAESAEELPQWLITLSNMPREQRQEYITSFSAAKQALARGEWIACETALTTCELILPDNPHVWNMRAVCCMEQKRFQEAEKELRKAQQALPDDAATLVNIATLHMLQGNYQACIDEISGLMEDTSHDLTHEVADILTFRIFLCHMMLGQESQALELVQDISPLADTPLYYYSRATVCLFKKDTVGAKADLQSAARIFGGTTLLTPYQRALLNCRLALPEEKKGVTAGASL